MTIPKELTGIGAGAFGFCQNLTDISVDENNQCLTAVDGVLFAQDMSALLCYPAGKTVPSYAIPAGITQIGSAAFIGCDNLMQLSLPEGITSIEEMAFSYCSNLESINLPGSVSMIGERAFSYCESLTEITIPGSVTYISDWAFEECFNLKKVTVLEGTRTIGIGTFSECSALESVSLSDSIDYIGERAFERCSSLLGVNLPDGITAIEDSTFEYCRNLERISIPKSVGYIDWQAFDGCYNLSRVLYQGTQEQWENIVIRAGNYDLKDAAKYYNCRYVSDNSFITYDGTTTIAYITPEDTYTGKTAILTLYKGNKLTDVVTGVYNGTQLELPSTAEHDKIKLMLWKNVSSVVPVCKAETVQTSSWNDN